MQDMSLVYQTFSGGQVITSALVPEPRAKLAEIPRYSRVAGARDIAWNVASNESPLPPGPAVVAAVARAAAQAHLYPSVGGDALVDAVSRRCGVPPDQVLVGGGSLALLQLALTTFTGAGTQVVHAWRSYEAYPILIGVADADAVPVPLDGDHRHDVGAMLAAITSRTAAVIVCNPNNPTGTALPDDLLLRLIEAVPPGVLVLLDEAYREFGDSTISAPELVRAHENVIVFRTFSKAYGLAGLRAGFALGSRGVVDTLRSVAQPFGLSSVAEVAAVAALDDTARLDEIVGTVRSRREIFSAQLRRRGIDVPESRSNFVYLPLRERAGQFAQACRNAGVAVRAFDGDGIRVTVGHSEAEERILGVLDAC